MELLSNIPIALINNIGFMAILYIMYESIKWVGNFKPSQLFVFALAIQIISLLQFIITIAAPNYFNLIQFSANFATIIIPLKNNNIHQWLFIIGVIYCSVLGYLLAKLYYHFMYLNQLNTQANYSRSNQFKSSLPTHLINNCTNIKIGLSNQINTPITFGWMHPIILLPIAICNQLTTKEIETILIHEIAHIIRKDYLMNMIISLNQMILFFNPFSILLNKELSLQREIACDLVVVKNSPQKLIYMNALLKIAEHVQHQNINRIKFTLGLFGKKSELLQRIQYFNNIYNKSFKQLLLKLTLGIFLGSIVFSTMLISKNVQINHIPFSTLNTTKITHFVEAKSMRKINKVDENKGFNKISKQKRQLDLSKESYSSLVDKTMLWIKQHEPTTKFAYYQDDLNKNTYKVADKLLINAIFSNYQLKRDLLNKQLANTHNLKEALDYLLESDEFEQIKQYEKWTKEFLQTHPIQKDTILLEDPIIY